MDSQQTAPISIVYCGNRKVFDGFLISALSVASVTKGRPLHFYFMTGDFSRIRSDYVPLKPSDADFIAEKLRLHNPDAEAHLLDCTDLYFKEFAHSVNAKTSYSPYSFIRLLLDFFDLPPKLLYLDVDTVALRDLAPLFDTEMKDYDIALVPDEVGTHYFGRDYGNSGVMLLNLDNIRRDALFEQCRKTVNERKLFMPDQTALNMHAKGKKLLLPGRCNDQIKLREDTVIRHYCKRFHWLPFPHSVNVKPWDGERFSRQFGDVHRELLAEWAEAKREWLGNEGSEAAHSSVAK
jgi:lipopolysaccharide biosynthesis glycosyltransferase